MLPTRPQRATIRAVDLLPTPPESISSMFRSKIHLFVAVTTALLTATCVLAQDAPKRFDGHQVVRVEVSSIRTLQTMLAISPDCWSESIGMGTLDFRIPPDRIKALRASGVEYTTLIEDVQELIDAENAWHETHRWIPGGAQGGVAGGSDFFDDYRTYDENVAWFDELIASYPDFITKQLAGTSIEGRNIWVYEITSPIEIEKAGICINSMAHAREWIGPMTVCWLVKTLLENYGTDPAITGALDEIRWYIIPMANPDGYVFSWTDNRLWRKTRLDNGDGTFGVDWNRNFGAGWGGAGASNDTNSDIYHGVAAFSEPETQALRDWILSHPDIVAHMDVHCYSQLMLTPYGYIDGDAPGADGSMYAALSRAMVDAIYSSDQRVYTPQPAHDLYIASGTSLDWSYDGANCISFTPELRDTGEFGFILPADQIRPTGIENFLSFMTLARAVRNKFYVALPNGWPGEVEAGVATPIAVDIAPTWNRSASVNSVQLLYTNGSTSDTIAFTPIGDGRWSGVLPALNCGDELTAFFEFTDDAENVRTWPQKSSLTTVANDIVLFFVDTFEEDLGWTVANDPELTDGAFERGLPQGGGDRGDPESDFDGSGQCYATNPLDGNTDVDGGGTTLTSPLLDGSQPGSELFYARFFSNNSGAAPNQDIFLVEISGDGGTSWQELETIGPEGPESSGDWYTRRWALSDIAGVGETEFLRVRFRAEDLGQGSVVEAAVDNVRIERVGCDGIIGDLNGDGLVNGADLTVLLGSWGACAGCIADLNFDEVVNGADLTIVLGNWS